MLQTHIKKKRITNGRIDMKLKKCITNSKILHASDLDDMSFRIFKYVCDKKDMFRVY